MSKWRELAKRTVSGVRLARGASLRARAALDSALPGHSPPPELLALLAESNGMKAPDGTALIWRVADILARNVAMRDPDQMDLTLYQPLVSLLFFGETGDGSLYAYDLTRRRSKHPTIIEWDHETDERSVVAADLEAYLKLRGAEWTGAKGPVPRDSAAVVSVWLGRHESKEKFDSYMAPGESGQVSPEGLPLSRFEAEWGLSLRDVLGREVQALLSPVPTSVRELLGDVLGAHSFAARLVKKAKAADLGKLRSAILIYGLDYMNTAVTARGDVFFAGSYRYE